MVSARLARDHVYWNDRYLANDRSAAPHPCEALVYAQSRLARSGVALDLACGVGGNAIWLARRGYQVHAVDFSSVAIDTTRSYSRGLSVQFHCVDLRRFDWPSSACDLVVVSRFLDRELCCDIAAAIAPGGLLVYQSFAGEFAGHGPRSSTFRLGSGELPGLFPTLQVIEIDPPDVAAQGYSILIAQRPKSEGGMHAAAR